MVRGVIAKPSVDQIKHIYQGELVDDEEIDFLRARVAELEAGGCARDQGTTQYCAEAVALQKRVAELERLAAFFASCIKSGEPWSETCETMYATDQHR
jgi:hypothetical protein